MKLAMVKINQIDELAIVGKDGLILMKTVNNKEDKSWSRSLLTVIEKNQLPEIASWFSTGGEENIEQMETIAFNECEYAPPIRYPRTIWGIGLNYVTDITEITSLPPVNPVTFLKPVTTVIGANEKIEIPTHSTRTTGEAELVIVIGTKCKNISVEEVPNVVAGLTTGLDMTEADIHAANPRFLARSKSFDTFFSFGPHILTIDEVDDILAIKIKTVKNKQVMHENSTANTIYHPWDIVAYLSQSTTLLPGDVILTGTPGPTVIRDGDVLECHIKGFAELANPVVQF
ncbi:fumarylacetoacetate hydrolase family protein [Salipaludibacillus sp. HK11]|uniref:fumarylacetoacetate hydrolase family protein n=1 Tax=Salipaludibacillus sp. HK11 TaxID=3394320 RepID=UPI0039FB913C